MKTFTFVVGLIFPVLLIACDSSSADDSGTTTEDSEALASSRSTCQEACRRRSAFEEADACLGKSDCPLVDDGKNNFGPLCTDLAKDRVRICKFVPALASECASVTHQLHICVAAYRAELRTLAASTFQSEIGGLCYGNPTPNNVLNHSRQCAAYNSDGEGKELWALVQPYLDPGQSLSCWQPCK
jgi:hypothetical protein